MQFLISKILALTDSSSICSSNTMFEAEMISITNRMDFVERYRECMGKVDSFNDFYR